MIDEVRKHLSFVALSSLIGQRIEAGESLYAYHMLIACSSPPDIAHKIIEEWPLEIDWVSRGFYETKLSLEELAACKLAHYIDDLDAYDWSSTLRLAARAAHTIRLQSGEATST